MAEPCGKTTNGDSAREGLNTSRCKVSVPIKECSEGFGRPARGKGRKKRDFALGAEAPVELSEMFMTDSVEGFSRSCLVPGAALFGRDAFEVARVVLEVDPLFGREQVRSPGCWLAL